MISSLIAHPNPDIFITAIEAIVRIFMGPSDKETESPAEKEIYLLFVKILIMFIFTMVSIIFSSITKENRFKKEG